MRGGQGLYSTVVLEYIRDHDIVLGAKERGFAFGQLLRAQLGGCRAAGDIRGIGMLWGVELVAEKPSKRKRPSLRRRG